MAESPKLRGASWLLKLIPYLITIASAIAAITPSHSDDEIVQAVKSIADIIALNVGHSAHEHDDLVSKTGCTKDEI
jgi:hypothetical protein